jgi:hypothetical protein
MLLLLLMLPPHVFSTREQSPSSQTKEKTRRSVRP